MSIMPMIFVFWSANKQGILGGREALILPKHCSREEARKGLSHMQVWRFLILVDEIQKSEFTPDSVAACWIYFMNHRPGSACMKPDFAFKHQAGCLHTSHMPIRMMQSSIRVLNTLYV